MRIFKLSICIILTFVLGFISGIYALPIISAPNSPSMLELATATQHTKYKGQFVTTLKDSDLLHFAKGDVSVSNDNIAFKGNIAPGPDYQLYLAKRFIETEADFHTFKGSMALLGDIKTFDSFIVPIPDAINIEEFNTVIIWCESFEQFISAAQYQSAHALPVVKKAI
ncbi:DM13 domain-containing protein [Pseudoalteromonas sp. MMG012]|uniref:DM13 domain-containing protein n=1 Tax=Pseudoalteromonas sp. MMG012 TaxID=2822686 RepID=UPI001B3A3261|nr:DM13 domain-containing protein [Pseudoalteromonas sp. MMG012]MBQ4850891.1 DM13 domain-containing protein [Pseudoalteromonas sp. MMG012]